MLKRKGFEIENGPHFNHHLTKLVELSNWNSPTDGTGKTNGIKSFKTETRKFRFFWNLSVCTVCRQSTRKTYLI